MANTIRKGFQKLFLLIMVVCSPQIIIGQISDDFSDGDFVQNPEWFGDINRFIVNNDGILQLKADEAGSSVLVTHSSYIDNCEWSFFIRLAFSPSSNNFARIYLASDTPDLKNEIHGYFIQFGESGSSDAIELFRQDGTETTSVCRGRESIISKSFALRLKIQHLDDGSWNIYTDLQDGNGYVPEASGFDNKFNRSDYFGFFAQYTISNSEKMYFDDLHISPIGDNSQQDRIPPRILGIQCPEQNKLEITFSESILTEDGLDKNNYHVSGESGNPEKIELAENNTIANLQFANPFENGASQTLYVKNIRDSSGNKMTDTSLIFRYFEVAPLDVVINEIMDDPSPPVGLPEYEFLEIFNTSAFDINLKDWILEINGKVNTFEEFVLPAGNYLIICNQNAEEYFTSYGNTYSFSGFSLPNTGNMILLRNNKNSLISSFHYQKSELTGPEKINGGWSLEQIDTESPCLELDNWSFSVNDNGGSPGQKNSVSAINKPKPKITSLELTSDSSLRLYFLNPMDELSLSDPANFEIVETHENPVRVETDLETKKVVELFFSNVFIKSRLYSLKVLNNLKNCLGLNLTNNTLITFVLPGEIKYGDIVINEILYQPLNQGEEYIELYNRSGKILDLSELEFCFIKNEFPQPADTVCVAIAQKQELLYPSTYWVLTREPEKVLAQYSCPSPENFTKITDLPRLVDDGAVIGIKNKNEIFIDRATYSEDMHYPLLVHTEGVSLEKIHYDLAGMDKSSWMSASFSVGFGTPAYKNSQFTEFTDASSIISVSPHVFTPDNDGRDDLLKIEYKLNHPGYTANIFVFNSEGVKIKQIVNNELLGTEGVFFWNGFDEDSEKMPRGIYIILTEFFDLNGNVKRYKNTAVLGERF